MIHAADLAGLPHVVGRTTEQGEQATHLGVPGFDRGKPRSDATSEPSHIAASSDAQCGKPTNADYDVVAEAEAITADAALINA